jgi:hypothetical protein
VPSIIWRSHLYSQRLKLCCPEPNTTPRSLLGLRGGGARQAGRAASSSERRQRLARLWQPSSTRLWQLAQHAGGLCPHSVRQHRPNQPRRRWCQPQPQPQPRPGPQPARTQPGQRRCGPHLEVMMSLESR